MPLASDTFLTGEEVRRLTGRSRRALQAAALRASGIPFTVDALGWPVVVRAAVVGRVAAAPAPAKPRAWSPDVLCRAK